MSVSVSEWCVYVSEWCVYVSEWCVYLFVCIEMEKDLGLIAVYKWCRWDIRVRMDLLNSRA